MKVCDAGMTDKSDDLDSWLALGLSLTSFIVPDVERGFQDETGMQGLM